MSRIRAFECVEHTRLTAVLRRRTVQLPLSRIVEERVLSDHRLAVCLPPPAGAVARDGFGTHRSLVVPVGRHAVEGVGPVRPFEGLLLSASVQELLNLVRQRVVPARGTSLHRWLAGRPLDDEALARLGFVLERHCLAPTGDIVDALLPSLPDGMFVSIHPEPLDLKVLRRERLWALRASGDGIAVVAPAPTEIAGGPAMRSVFAVFPSGRGAVGWWDGRSYGYSQGLGDLPAALRDRLEAHGMAWKATSAHTRPRTDQRALFLLRVPAHTEVPGRQGRVVRPVPVASCPAILEPFDSTVPLLDCAGRPLSLPVFADPIDALSVLARASGGRIFVPHAEPMDLADVNLPATAAWRIGCLPGSVSP